MTASRLPAVRYARTEDGADLAFWSQGRGPTLLYVPNVQLSHLVAEWEVDGPRRFFQALSRSFTLVRFDHRGGGLSQRGRAEYSIDALVRDVEAIAARTPPGPFAMFGAMTGGLSAVAYAARHPESVSHLVLWSSFARDASHGGAPRMRSLFRMAADDWEMFSESLAQAALGWQDGDAARQWATAMRQASTQEEFLPFLQARSEWDVSELLPTIQVPTLVLHDPHNALASEERSREIAAAIPGARFLAAPGQAGAPGPEATDAIRTFISGGETPPAPVDGLTRRESEILSLLATGATNPEIAKRLSISIHTVTRHLTHIYRKTGAGGRAQAIRYALDRGIES